jgi:hypothetical protein
MNKLNLHPSPMTHPAGARSSSPTPWLSSVNPSREQHRLLVLIPADLECGAIIEEIWELAQATTSPNIQLLSLCKDGVEEPGLRRRLATICALIQDGGVSVEAKVEIGASWVEIIKRHHQKGDLVVCFAEQRAGFLQRPLNQILQSNLNVQVYILSSLSAQNSPKTNWLSQIAAWAGSVGIIAGAFLLQVRITSLPQDWAQTTLLISSVGGEMWLIWVWNNLFS